MEAGNTVALTCVGYGDPTVSVTWNMADVQLSNSSGITIYDELVTGNGIILVQSILVICGVEETDSGQYSCIVNNVLGNTSVNFDLSVTPTGGKYVCDVDVVRTSGTLKFSLLLYIQTRLRS